MSREHAELPVWRCHKLVRAAKIKAVVYDSGITVAGFGIVAGPGNAILVRLEGGAEVPIDGSVLFARGAPDIGDYLVRYEPDGYLSWSPAKAFEDGYTLVAPAGTRTCSRCVGTGVFGEMCQGCAGSGRVRV